MQKSKKNKTLILSGSERKELKRNLLHTISLNDKYPQGTLHGDSFKLMPQLPRNFVDLIFLDPPYNMYKNFNGLVFNRLKVKGYTDWLDNLFQQMKHVLKPSASVYICGDWFSSSSIFEAASKHFIVRNRITWEREKGRGAESNWKNSSEDVWFCTVSEKFTFNIDAVKIRRKVMAPYRENGVPKDWKTSGSGNYRDTHPSNLWTDITIPFWSMPENTVHPTQKSEKLLAKIILCSTNEGDMVFDPFLGSGTTSVTAKKLGRRFLGIEANEEYCLIAEKRLKEADTNKVIQGFSDGVFWERNTFRHQRKNPEKS